MNSLSVSCKVSTLLCNRDLVACKYHRLSRQLETGYEMDFSEQWGVILQGTIIGFRPATINV